MMTLNCGKKDNRVFALRSVAKTFFGWGKSPYIMQMLSKNDQNLFLIMKTKYVGTVIPEIRPGSIRFQYLNIINQTIVHYFIFYFPLKII